MFVFHACFNPFGWKQVWKISILSKTTCFIWKTTMFGQLSKQSNRMSKLYQFQTIRLFFRIGACGQETPSYFFSISTSKNGTINQFWEYKNITLCMATKRQSFEIRVQFPKFVHTGSSNANNFWILLSKLNLIFSCLHVKYVFFLS